MKTQVAIESVVARLRGFEPPTSGSGDQRQNAMLMILLAQSCKVLHGFVRYSALNGPKSDPSFGMNPYSETKIGHTWQFLVSLGLYLLSPILSSASSRSVEEVVGAKRNSRKMAFGVQNAAIRAA